MRKILLLLLPLTFLCCTKTEDIGEIISLRDKYQAEYNIYHAEWNLRQLQRLGYIDKYASLESTFEEFQREQICKDSIEILNIKIENIKKGK